MHFPAKQATRLIQNHPQLMAIQLGNEPQRKCTTYQPAQIAPIHSNMMTFFFQHETKINGRTRTRYLAAKQAIITTKLLWMQTFVLVDACTHSTHNKHRKHTENVFNNVFILFCFFFFGLSVCCYSNNKQRTTSINKNYVQNENKQQFAQFIMFYL